MTQYNTIAELQNFIVLDSYTKHSMLNESPVGYQSEAALERELIEDLVGQGYEYLPQLISPEALLVNLRQQLERLNNVTFTDEEWQRFLDLLSPTGHGRFRRTTSTTLSLMTDTSRTSILLIRKTPHAISCKSSISLNKQERRLTDMM